MRPIILPRPEFSPDLPSSPGAPGTILTNRSDIFDFGPISLWVKTAPEEGLWKYFGNYRFARSVQPLTADETGQFDELTRNAWARLLSNKKYDYHAELRVRIWLRKVGMRVTEKLVAVQMDLLRANESLIELNESDIAEALCSWKETLHVVTMRCVGYDHDFLTDVETRWKKWQATASAKPEKYPMQEIFGSSVELNHPAHLLVYSLASSKSFTHFFHFPRLRSPLRLHIPIISPALFRRQARS
ncbi:hypothetical protein EVG20_g4869 [Dentipellis fragilis]|uniref:DUF6697 domain-containing protein n=1 Tax=Dentipellis fragilis TaxID=205917 RepID=A0A4Y9YX44_9AGAM|nr:hypothetical protein EVG20_g4869 [Dentipellis fragilis]